MQIEYTLNPYEPKRIISIVGPSRSGSTVIKHALSLHPDICSLAGEEEPYYKLAKNGYPWHGSDEFHVPNNPELIRQLIHAEITNYNSEYNRGYLQYHKIEEPPFVEAKQCHITDTLLLKTPQNCYRRGVLEYLYPNAKIQYIVIQRDPRAIVNGLLDGWISEDFKARWVPEFGWFKFDMPPNWASTCRKDSLREICINQCKMAIEYCRKDYADALPISYESSITDWRAATKKAWKFLGLRDYEPTGELPILMATDQPSPDRWRQKRPWLEELVI